MNWKNVCAKSLEGLKEFPADDVTDRMLSKLEIIPWSVAFRAVAQATLIARRMQLPDPEPDSLAARVADLSDADAMAEVLLEALKSGAIFLEDFRREIAWSLALLKLERRAALWMAEPTAPDALEPLGNGCYRRPRRLMQEAAV